MGLPARLYRRRHRRRKEPVLTSSSYRILTFDTLGSTNDEAMARLKADDPGGFVVTASRQTGGRGRQGRAWASPPGNLYASLALVDPAPLALAPQLGFVAGVALCETLRARLRGDTRLQIKWPNDMVFAGAKLAGILLESATLAGDRLGCVIGFGVNCVSHPEDLPYRATDLGVAGDPEPDARAVLSTLASEMQRRLATWRRGAGFAEIREAWLARAAGLQSQVTVSAPRGERLEGRFRGLDAAGRLLLETDAGNLVIDAGDVFLPGVAAGAMEA